jgi:hypothetical protein
VIQRSRTSPLRAIVLGATLAVLIAAPASAGRTSGTISIANGVFAGTTTATKTGSTITWVRALCYQNSVLVYEQYQKFGTSTTAKLTLGPTPSWTSGAASCRGEGGYFSNGRWRVAATTTFSVAG